MKRIVVLVCIVLAYHSGLQAQSSVPEKSGWWKFDVPSDPLKAEIGNELTLTGSSESVEGPTTGNLAVKIGAGSYLSMEHGIATPVNEYTIMVDFSVPLIDGYNAIFQTTPENTDDAEFFINGQGLVGAWRIGYSDSVIVADNWYRMVVSVRNGEFYRVFVNGNLWVEGVPQDPDSRDALEDFLLFFADEDGEDKDILCSELAIWSVALTADEAAELGNASQAYTGINSPAVSLSDLSQNFPNPFSTQTCINYQVRVEGEVVFQLVDHLGKTVMTINEGKQVPGEYSFVLSARELENGIYFLRMDNATGRSTCKIIVQK